MWFLGGVNMKTKEHSAHWNTWMCSDLLLMSFTVSLYSLHWQIYRWEQPFVMNTLTVHLTVSLSHIYSGAVTPYRSDLGDFTLKTSHSHKNQINTQYKLFIRFLYEQFAMFKWAPLKVAVIVETVQYWNTSFTTAEYHMKQVVTS